MVEQVLVKTYIIAREKCMNIMDFEVCMKGQIADVPEDIGNEVKANWLKKLKY